MGLKTFHKYSPYLVKKCEMFRAILSVPHNTIIDLNDVMQHSQKLLACKAFIIVKSSLWGEATTSWHKLVRKLTPKGLCSMQTMIATSHEIPLKNEVCRWLRDCFTRRMLKFVTLFKSIKMFCEIVSNPSNILHIQKECEEYFVEYFYFLWDQFLAIACPKWTTFWKVMTFIWLMILECHLQRHRRAIAVKNQLQSLTDSSSFVSSRRRRSRR
jgi:hypothetical protein